MEQTKAKQTVTINDKVYDESELSDKVKQLINVYRIWNDDLSKQRLEAAKTEAAIKSLSQEIATEIEQMDKQKA